MNQGKWTLVVGIKRFQFQEFYRRNLRRKLPNLMAWEKDHESVTSAFKLRIMDLECGKKRIWENSIFDKIGNFEPKAKIGENGPRAILKAKTLISLEMKYEGYYEKEFCKMNDRIGNWVENERKSEVLRGEILI